MNEAVTNPTDEQLIAEYAPFTEPIHNAWEVVVFQCYGLTLVGYELLLINLFHVKPLPEAWMASVITNSVTHFMTHDGIEIVFYVSQVTGLPPFFRIQ